MYDSKYLETRPGIPFIKLDFHLMQQSFSGSHSLHYMPVSRAFVRIEDSWLRICAINKINCETLCYKKMHMGFPFVMRGPKSLRGQRLKSKVQRMEIYDCTKSMLPAKLSIPQLGV